MTDFNPGDRRLVKAITQDDFERVTYREDADLVSSQVGRGYHMPVLDIDYPAQLVPSSTEGHFHLYLDVAMPWSTYKRLLYALEEAGVIQTGYCEGAVRRGASFARLPEKPKHLEKPGHPLYKKNSLNDGGEPEASNE